MKTSGRLTEADLLAALKKLEEKPLIMCTHVVSPRELKRAGWVICANCFSPVKLP